MKSLLLLMIMMSTTPLLALEYGCRMKPNQLGEVATRTLVNFHNEKKSMPDSMLVTMDVDGEVDATGHPTQVDGYGTVEGFYRPIEDDFYSVIPIPILGVALSRDRNIIYICAHYDSDPKKTHVTVYMMRGHHLDETKISTLVGDLIYDPKVKVMPLTASVLGVGKMRKTFLFWLNWIPLLDVTSDILDGLQRLLANALGDFVGIGVERIVLTNDYVEISSRIDLDNPSKARILKKIDLTKFRKKPSALIP